MTKLIAILNLTPDSFSDGGKYDNFDAAIFRVKQAISDGADVIDIGAESTRPGASIVGEDVEWQRLKKILPEVIDYVKNYNRNHKKKIQISLDSRNFSTVKKSVDLGIDIINDVSGFDDLRMAHLAVKSHKKIVVMHNLGIPADKSKIIPENLDIIEVVLAWMNNKMKNLIELGIKKEQIIFDPGIGFGKNSFQSITILKNINKLKVLGLPLFIGHSEKSFLSNFNFRESLSNYNKSEKTIFISKYLFDNNIDYIRVHDVAKNKAVFDIIPFP